jgi:hypothetical protein
MTTPAPTRPACDSTPDPRSPTRDDPTTYSRKPPPRSIRGSKYRPAQNISGTLQDGVDKHRSIVRRGLAAQRPANSITGCDGHGAGLVTAAQ